MKKTTFLVCLALLLSATRVIALDTSDSTMVGIKVESVDETLTNKQIVEKLVDKYAVEYGVSKIALMKTLTAENDTYQFDRQSGLKYKAGNRWGMPAGTLEQSFGVAQIHLPDHPTITKAQAIDPDFSVRFMAQQFAKGNARQWMGYSKI